MLVTVQWILSDYNYSTSHPLKRKACASFIQITGAVRKNDNAEFSEEKGDGDADILLLT